MRYTLQRIMRRAVTPASRSVKAMYQKRSANYNIGALRAQSYVHEYNELLNGALARLVRFASQLLTLATHAILPMVVCSAIRDDVANREKHEQRSGNRMSAGEGKKAYDEDQRMIREGAAALSSAVDVSDDGERAPDDTTRPPAFLLGLAVVVGLIIVFGAIYFFSQG